MSFGPIQMLDFIVDPSSDAFLTDDGVKGQTPPGTTVDGVDISEGGGLGSDGYADPRQAGHYVRRRGSGSRRGLHQKIAPKARNDTLTTSIGASASNVDVLANDTYSGSPSILILSGPLLDGALAVVTGTGAASRIRYTPPASGYATGAADEVVYRLRATGNSNSSGSLRGQDVATLFVTIPGPDDPHVGGSYTFTGSWFIQDVEWSFEILGAFSVWNGGTSSFKAWVWDERDGPPYDPFPDAGALTIMITAGDADAIYALGEGAVSFGMTLGALSGGVYSATLSGIH